MTLEEFDLYEINAPSEFYLEGRHIEIRFNPDGYHTVLINNHIVLSRVLHGDLHERIVELIA